MVVIRCAINYVDRWGLRIAVGVCWLAVVGMFVALGFEFVALVSQGENPQEVHRRARIERLYRSSFSQSRQALRSGEYGRAVAQLKWAEWWDRQLGVHPYE